MIQPPVKVCKHPYIRRSDESPLQNSHCAAHWAYTAFVTMWYELVLLTSIFADVNAILECPKGSLPFDLEECDPNRRSQCPSGFTCRRANDTSRPERKLYLCCATEQMTIEDWFFDAGLSPEVFPQTPLSMLKSIEMVPVDSTTAFPTVHTGDE
ncbi:hypothetical protein GCK32_013290, partial [Trichostrongylus colubriformis]